MNKSPKRHRRPFWFWAVVVLLTGGMLYPLSVGPAMRLWIVDDRISEHTVMRYYWPVFYVLNFAPQPIASAVNWYTELWLAHDADAT